MACADQNPCFRWIAGLHKLIMNETTYSISLHYYIFPQSVHLATIIKNYLTRSISITQQCITTETSTIPRNFIHIHTMKFLNHGCCANPYKYYLECNTNLYPIFLYNLGEIPHYCVIALSWEQVAKTQAKQRGNN